MKASIPPPEGQRPDPEVIPEAMRAARRWVTYRLPSKQPFYASGRPRSGRLDSERDSAQLVSFEEACAAVHASAGLLAGVGFALGAGWHGGDLDGCRDPATGFLTPWAKSIIERCATYVEISQSGKGLHILTYDPKADLSALGANGSGAEFYSRARYFIVTGNCLQPAPRRWPKAGKIRDLFEERWTGGKAASTKAARELSSRATFPEGGAGIEWPGLARELDEGLKHVPCEAGNYQRWRDVGFGIHYAAGGSEAGFQVWHAWSKIVAGYEGEADCRKYWAGFKARRGTAIRYGTVKRLMQQYAPVVKPLPQGEGLLPFADIMVEPVVREPIISGWLFERVVLLQAADGGTGKSYMGLLEAMMVARGAACGIAWSVTKGRVLFYSGEDDADTIKIRMRAYCSFYGWRMEDFRESLVVVDRSETDCVLYNEVGGFTEEYALLKRTVEQYDPRYVVIDNASHVFNANENNRSLVRHFLSGLTAFKRAVNLLAHVNKVTAGAASGGNQAVAYSGSTAWSNTVRARRAQSFEEGRGVITIAKSNYGPTGTTLRYEWDDLHKLFIPRAVITREHARDHTELLLAIVKQLEGTLSSLDPRAPNHLAKRIQAHVECPKGIDLRALKRWTEQMLTHGRIEERAMMKANRRPGKTFGVR